MYQKYNTEALVLSSRESGEGDKVLALYTRDFGLVRARASAVRAEKSRMRYALQNYAHANCSLVRGKRGWRIAGATALKNAPHSARALGSFARIAQLLLRLVGEGEKSDYLFAALVQAHHALASSEAAAGTIELVCVARILFVLGYISTEALETALFTHTAYTGESLLEAETMKEKLLSSINKAIAETQL